MQTPGAPEKAYVLVEYEFEYTAKDGRLISIKPNERYILLKRTNDHWWHVRQDEHSKPFYIPAKYVKELPLAGQPSNGLPPHSEPQPTDSSNDTSVVDSQEYSYKFISGTTDMPTNPYSQKSNLHQPQFSQAESGSNLSIPDIFVSDVILRKGSREDLLPRIGEEKSSSTSTFAPLRTFGSFQRLPIRKTMYGPEFTSIRSSQSLDDLARLTPERANGGRRTQVVAGARVHSRSLTRSDSENIYETIKDLPGQRNAVTSPAENKSKAQKNLSSEAISTHVTGRSNQNNLSPKLDRGHALRGSDPHLQTLLSVTISTASPYGVIFDEVGGGSRFLSNDRLVLQDSNMVDLLAKMPGRLRRLSSRLSTSSQVSQEKISSPVYVNIAELQQEAARSGTSSRPHSSSSNLDEWETHTDQESGKLFYYNSITRETTWDSPYYQPEDPGTSPGSITSAASLNESEWERYFDEPSGCFFFHNSNTGETSWQPPEPEELSPREMKSVNSPFYAMEQRPPTPETDYPENSPVYDTFPEEDYSPPQTHNSFIFPHIQPQRSPTDCDTVGLPPGYTYGVKDGKMVYTHIDTHETWIMSKDDQGQHFFHTPDGSDSRWHLPQRPPPRPIHRASVDSEPDSIGFSTWNMHAPTFIIPRNNEDPDVPIRRNALDFAADHRQSMFLESIQRHPKSLDKAGVLHKTKIAENGKRLRKKNWSTSWTVLEGSILTFYKDNKNLSTSSMKQSSNFSTPEYTVDLHGASICWAAKEKSSKKNVLELKTRTGSEFLIQHDTEYITEDWYNIILDSIQTMSTDTFVQPSELPRDFSPNERIETNNKDKEEKEKKTPAQKSHDYNSDSDSSRVRNKLKRLLQRRPTMQSLRDKGYIKDQVFGCHLHVLCEREKTSVPKFVRECIKTVENRGLDIDGLYRISGNLATIQKLRFRVDHDENLNLDDGRWEDVHVITGALKLFFRELPEPLFPFSHFDRFISAIKIPDPKAQMKYMKELVQSLPPPNRETMKALFQHLCRVIEKREENRMSVKSVAIVFGPTLLKKESESGNIAVHMVFQNQIVELILSNCIYIFADS